MSHFKPIFKQKGTFSPQSPKNGPKMVQKCRKRPILTKNENFWGHWKLDLSQNDINEALLPYKIVTFVDLHKWEKFGHTQYTSLKLSFIKSTQKVVRSRINLDKSTYKKWNEEKSCAAPH